MFLPILMAGAGSFALFLATALVAVQAGMAQAPRIGVVDFYGVRKVSQERLRKAIVVKEGDPLPRSKGDVEEILEKVPGVVRANLEAACCEDGKAILYVGIEEKGAPHFDYLPPPSGLLKLPQEIHDEYTQFLAALGLAVRAGEIEEDLSEGHSLMRNTGCRKHQERFVSLAETHLDKISAVVRESVDEEHRAIAAYVIGYAPKKPEVMEKVIGHLQHALRDSDDTVRNNAMRSLGAFAVLSARKPEIGLRIAPTWFIEMLDSLIWSDRTTAASVLVTLSENRDKDLLQRLKERAIEPLREMSRWKHLPHALPSFILLGRIAGMEEEAIRQAWAQPERITVLDKALKAASSGK
ncbi:MAG: hypothetical protein JJE04_23335 [Acidobacteriia bacterium]|nr:hypothetical protein [Terriglobia bacterium]